MEVLVLIFSAIDWLLLLFCLSDLQHYDLGGLLIVYVSTLN